MLTPSTNSTSFRGRLTRRALGGSPLSRALGRVPDAVALAAVAALFWVVLGVMPGCGGWGGVPSPTALAERLAPKPPPEAVPDKEMPKDALISQRDKAQVKLDSAANAIGWLAGLCAIAALGTLVLSFIIPIIPTKTSAGCFAACLAGYALQYALLVYGVLFAEVAIWLGVVVLGGIGASVLIPWAIATVSFLQARTGKKLIAEGQAKGDTKDIRAGVALIAEAEAMKPAERKELLAEVSTGSKP